MEKAGQTRWLVSRIRKSQAAFIGHIMIRRQLEHHITLGKLEEKRGRGSQREQLVDSLAAWMDIVKATYLISATKDRGCWKDMMANAIKQGT